MQISTIKRQGDGYLVNDNMFVPADEANTHYQIVKKHLEDGGTVDEELNTDSLEVLRVQSIKAKAAELINAKYPQYKQLNIIRTGGKELDLMSEYIDNIRVQSNALEANKDKTANDFALN